MSWYEDPEDTELMKLVAPLRALSKVDDVRPVILQSTFEDTLQIDRVLIICESLMMHKNKIKEENKTSTSSTEKKMHKRRSSEQISKQRPTKEQ